MANSLTWSLYGKDVSASKALKGVEEAGEKTNSVFKTMAGVAGGALAALGISNALGAVKGYLTESVAAYKEAATSQLQLTTAYEKFPGMASVSIDSLRALNTELMNKTRFDDDAFASGQSLLAQFGLTGDQVAALTPLMADYAARTGKDLPTAADDLGKAMLGQGRALKSVGIDFDDAGSVAANFDQVMAGMSAQVGGFAEKDAAAGEGAAQRLKNNMQELQETIGSGLLPIIYQLQGAFLEHVVPTLTLLAQTFADNVGPAFNGLVGMIGPIIAMLADKFGPILSILGPQVLSLASSFSPLGLILQALQPVLPIIGDLLLMIAEMMSGYLAQAIPMITSLVGGLVGIMSGVLAQVLPIIAAMLGNLGGVFEMLMPVIMQLVGAIGGAFLTVLTALAPIIPILFGVLMQLVTALMPLIPPILGIVMAFLPLISILGELIGALLPPIIQLFMAILMPILSLITPLVELLVPALTWVADAISVVIGWLTDWFGSLEGLGPIIAIVADTIKNVLGGIAGFVGDVFKNVANFVVGGINMIIDLVNGAIGLVNDLGKTAALVSGGAVSWRVDPLPRIPMLAAGGIVSAATIAMIGEGSEPEVVAPLSKLPGLMRSAGISGGGDNGGEFTGNLYLDSGQLLGLVRGEIRKADDDNVLTSKMGKSSR